MAKALFVAGGILFTGIGTAGIVVPLVPTTPFYLLAVFSFAKGSVRFQRWFTGTRLYKKHLDGFIENRSMTRRTKGCILAYASVMLLLAIFLLDVFVIRILLLTILATKYWYFIFRVKTMR